MGLVFMVALVAAFPPWGGVVVFSRCYSEHRGALPPMSRYSLFEHGIRLPVFCQACHCVLVDITPRGTCAY